MKVHLKSKSGELIKEIEAPFEPTYMLPEVIIWDNRFFKFWNTIGQFDQLMIPEYREFTSVWFAP